MLASYGDMELAAWVYLGTVLGSLREIEPHKKDREGGFHSVQYCFLSRIISKGHSLKEQFKKFPITYNSVNCHLYHLIHSV